VNTAHNPRPSPTTMTLHPPYLNNGALAAMADWLAVRGDGAGALFVAVNKGGRLGAHHGASSLGHVAQAGGGSGCQGILTA
jgi:hypothetical protein